MEKYGICPLSYIPVRETIDKNAPTSNQMIWGDMFEILEKKSEYFFIRLTHDDSEGWVDIRQVLVIDKDFYSSRNFEIVGHISNTRAKLLLSQGGYIDLPFGAQLSIQEWESRTIYWKGLEGKLVGCGDYEALPEIKNSIEKMKSYLEYLPKAPYIKGGRTQWGWDAPGFIQSLFRVCGIPYIKRNIEEQVKQGREVSLEKSQTGDLFFFSERKGEKANHVGVMVSENKIWHCLSSLRVNALVGEYLTDELEKKTHQIHSVRSIL